MSVGGVVLHEVHARLSCEAAGVSQVLQTQNYLLQLTTTHDTRVFHLEAALLPSLWMAPH